MARDIAARTGRLRSADEPFNELLSLLGREGYASGTALQLFHYLSGRPATMPSTMTSTTSPPLWDAS